MVEDLAIAGGQLLAGHTSGADGDGLVIFSRKLGKGTIASSGYVDNEWDTQRRRGVRLTTRTTF
jgi:hypothetical protein